jgi:STE24 endopeptidase
MWFSSSRSIDVVVESPPSYLKGVLGFIVTMWLFQSWLETRQLRELKRKEPPKELNKVVSAKEFKATRSYGLDKWYFGFLQSCVTTAESVAFLAYGGLSATWSLSSDLSLKLPFDWDQEIQTSIIFTVVSSLATTLLQQPFSLYGTFVLEQKHGFNKTTFWIYLTDLVKGSALLVVISPPLLIVIVKILRNTGPYVALQLWTFILLFNVFLMTIYPTVIAPMFNKYSPLEDGPLKKKIEGLARRLDYPLKKLFVMDASKRSGHSNAFMYGFYKNKRIVLFDTLLSQCKSDDTVVAILAHELGHWKLSHTPVLFVSSMTVLLLQLSAYTFISNSTGLFESFGFHGSKPALIGLILFQYIISPVDVIIEFLSNMLSRLFEFQADRFAVEQGYPEELKEGLITLHKENKSSYNIDPLYSTYHFSHPPLIERIRAIDKESKKHE